PGHKLPSILGESDLQRVVITAGLEWVGVRHRQQPGHHLSALVKLARRNDAARKLRRAHRLSIARQLSGRPECCDRSRGEIAVAHGRGRNRSLDLSGGEVLVEIFKTREEEELVAVLIE